MKMKNIIYLFAAVAMLFGACSPNDYSMSSPDLQTADLVEGVAYTVTHDAENPNIIYLKSLLDTKYQCLWTHPQGRSQAGEVKLEIPFPGTYEVTFGVETRGGVVYGNPSTFTVDNFCADFVSNEQWMFLTGGVGKSKKWIPDNGKYGFAAGEMTFADPSVTQEFNNWTANWDPGAGYTEMDFSSYMVFDLIGGAHVEVFDGSTTWNGTYLLNTDAHTISFTDAVLLHSPGWENRTPNWSKDLRFFELDENHMRIGILRDPSTSGEGEWWVIWNFVSQEYADNYQYEAPVVYPTLPDDWRDWFDQKTNLETTYLLSDEQPFDWCGPDGKNKNITQFTASPYLEDFSLTLHSGKRTYTCTVPGGETISGTYTLDDDGIFTFSDGLPSFALDKDGEVMFTAANNQLRIMNFDVDDYSGKLASAWLGSAEIDDKGTLYQYQAVQLVPKSEGGAVERYTATLRYFDAGWNFQQSEDVYVTGNGTYTITINGDHGEEPYGLYLDICKILKKNPNCDIVIKDIVVDGASVAFDDADIDRGYGDSSGQENADARRYVVNPWGASAGYKDRIAFTSTLSVVFEVIMDNGTPFIPAE